MGAWRRSSPVQQLAFHPDFRPRGADRLFDHRAHHDSAAGPGDRRITSISAIASRKSLKMTKQEVKEEMQPMDGDPRSRAAAGRSRFRSSRKRFKKDVPTADVVVTNPTEFADRDEIRRDTMHAPRVVAKGQGYMAMQIREIAIEHGIPILERKPLARRSTNWWTSGRKSRNSFTPPSRRFWRMCTS